MPLETILNYKVFSKILRISEKVHCLIKLLDNDVGVEGANEKRKKPLFSFVKKDLIDEAQESTNYIIEKDIHGPCGYESVNATLHQMFEELPKLGYIIDSHSQTSSDRDETGSYSSADEHSEIEPL